MAFVLLFCIFQEAENIVMKIKQQQYQELLCRDQLTMERADGKVFLYYGESQAFSYFSKLTLHHTQEIQFWPKLTQGYREWTFLFRPKLPLL